MKITQFQGERQIKVYSLFLIFSFLLILEGGCQDPNLTRMKDLSNFELTFDSVKQYYVDVHYRYYDGLYGVSSRSYYGPDSLQGFAEYMTLAPYKDGKRLHKGIGYSLTTSGTFFGIANWDWSGLKHGNQLTFHANGTVKKNEVWNRGELIEHWLYNKNGELIEHKEF